MKPCNKFVDPFFVYFDGQVHLSACVRSYAYCGRQRQSREGLEANHNEIKSRDEINKVPKSVCVVLKSINEVLPARLPPRLPACLPGSSDLPECNVLANASNEFGKACLCSLK